MPRSYLRCATCAAAEVLLRRCAMWRREKPMRRGYRAFRGGTRAPVFCSSTRRVECWAI